MWGFISEFFSVLLNGTHYLHFWEPALLFGHGDMA